MPGVSKQYLRDPHRATDGYVQDFQGIERVEPDQLTKQVARLDLSSRKLLEGFMPHAGGRPPRAPDLEYFISQAESFLEEYGRAPMTIHEFAEFIDMPVSTIRDHLKAGRSIAVERLQDELLLRSSTPPSAHPNALSFP